MQDHIRILIADDDATNRHALIESIHQTHKGITVRAATSCREVTDAMMSGKFDCALLDEMLQGENGIDCLLEVRKAGITMPVILLLAGKGDVAALDAEDVGATIALPKNDVTLPLLESCLSSALRIYRSEQQTRKVQEELKLRDRAIAAASNGIIICDALADDWPIIYSNPAFTAMTGYLQEEIVGRNCRFLQGKDTDPYYVQQVRDCLREERDGQIILRNYRKDGTPFWNELTLSPVRDSNGKLTHYVGVQTDITERRNAEDALRESIKRQQTMLKDVFRNATEGKLRLCNSEDDLPPRLKAFGDPIDLYIGNGVRNLRKQAIEACNEIDASKERCDDLETAVGEAGMNAIVHSISGTGSVFTAKSHEQGTVQVKISDEGKGISVDNLPNATLLRGFSTAGTMGQGIKMMLKLADRVYLLTGSTGTTVVLEQDRVAPGSPW